ncbi:hypothetical protein DNTS_035019 [Danionella cerebrum]|uniref:Uncharacterized protein n=1 Tax=Danionella cerebrum TaxID=2873325 RepID=A0A553R3D3_9TELE|nr:hypothetical protein DNTS_035019 [Danionella translucida]
MEHAGGARSDLREEEPALKPRSSDVEDLFLRDRQRERAAERVSARLFSQQLKWSSGTGGVLQYDEKLSSARKNGWYDEPEQESPPSGGSLHPVNMPTGTLLYPHLTMSPEQFLCQSLRSPDYLWLSGTPAPAGRLDEVG